MVDFRVYEPGEEALDIYRFRYKIYEEEMKQNDFYADHDQKIIRDALDDFAYNIAAYRDGEIIGTARVNFCEDGDPGYYLDYYEMESVGADYPLKVSFSTRIMVSEEERGGVTPLLISVECFKLGLARGVKWCFCDCAEEVRPFFARLGYEVQNPSKDHKNYGPGAVMRFNLDDPKHYDKRQSVFARYLDGVKPK
ncbi:MAG: hypothetical protein AAGA09_09465 [Pseudomonadota bacterium]